MDDLTQREDKDSRYTLEVMANHRAMSDHGRQAADIYAEADGEAVAMLDVETLAAAAGEVMRYLYELACQHPALPSIVLIRTYEPTATIRDLAKRCLWGRSMAQDAVEQLARNQPRLRDILHPPTKRVRAQCARRKRERGCHVPE
jgi:hypothetical protein